MSSSTPIDAFATPCCPKCAAPADAVLETIQCATPIDLESNGAWDWSSGRSSEMFWDTSEPIVRNGLYTLRCPARHEWSSARGSREALPSCKLVVWEIDYEGDPDDTPEEIAEWARARQRDPDSIATVFTVVDKETGDRTVVDLTPKEGGSPNC